MSRKMANLQARGAGAGIRARRGGPASRAKTRRGAASPTSDTFGIGLRAGVIRLDGGEGSGEKMLAMSGFTPWTGWLAWVPALFAVAFPWTSLADDTVDFRQRVEPVLRAHCYGCHSHDSGKMKGGLTLDSRSGWAEGGDHGPAIVPGSPDGSRLIRAIRRSEGVRPMPPERPLEGDDVAVLVDWVRRGAPDPRGVPKPALDKARDTWWALRPLVRREIPKSREGNPVDAWLEASGVAFSDAPEPTETDAIFLRRLMLDLHGLVPTPEEVLAFSASRRAGPGAWGEQVDRLLSSPRYGERWARHWLDVVHYAETHGHDQDRPRDNAWPYRDYLVAAFNSDKPFARFVQEQIATDALFPEEPALTPALGFLAAGPWDESSLRDIREDVLDREIGRYLDRDDIVANVMSTFASVTVHCARCHDHKFDPITQRDYYALQAVFAGTEKAERLYDLDPAMHEQRQKWLALQIALERKDQERVETLLDDGLRAEQRAWENATRERPVSWTVLRPESWFSEVPTTFDGEVRSDPPTPSIRGGSGESGLRLLEDGSLLAFGRAPATNIYVFQARVELPGVAALRVEVLPDDSLPAKGPGRAENGNFHLTGLDVYTGAPRGELHEKVALANPSADFQQQGWEIAKTFDDDPITGWGIHPEEGKPHVATVELSRPGSLPAGNQLRLVLRQEHGRGHTLGRLRISVTTNAPPIRATPVPESVARALAVGTEKRSAEERFAVTAHFLSGRVKRELDALPPAKRVYAGAHVFLPNGGQKALGRPRPIHVLRRGEILKPLEPAEPGALQCVEALPSRFGVMSNDADRRAALARWLTDPANPLVWRSIVNRVWHYHFGRGLVETPNDFGRMGSPPGHLELLDWLAVTFRDDFEGSLKQLHRLVLGSRAWRQRAADPLGPEPFRPLRRRLDAESFRDSLLRLAGKLDDRMGGPSVRQFAMSPGIHVTPKVDYAAYDPDTPENYRRSIYRFLFRTLPDPLMDAMDSPAGDFSAPTRSESFTALQAFALLNHPFVVRQSEHLAERVRKENADLAGQVRRLCALVFLREPTPEEQGEWADYARRHGQAGLARLVLNSNEFQFID